MAALAGKIAVVTGASRGIGRGIAVGLGEAGATVYVTGRSSDPSAAPWRRTVQETAELVTDAGGTGIAVGCDHHDDAAVAALFERVARESGGLDLLVNNAAAIPTDLDEIFAERPFWTLPVQLWDELFDVGVRSHFVAAQYAAQLMTAQRRGFIINVSSGAAQTKAGVVPYSVAKAAVDKLTADMAVELQPYGVAVVSVWPPPTSTEGMLAVARGGAASKWSEPVFTGRVVAALAQAASPMAWSGTALRVRELAAELGVSDILHSG